MLRFRKNYFLNINNTVFMSDIDSKNNLIYFSEVEKTDLLLPLQDKLRIRTKYIDSCNLC